MEDEEHPLDEHQVNEKHRKSGDGVPELDDVRRAVVVGLAKINQ